MLFPTHVRQQVTDSPAISTAGRPVAGGVVEGRGAARRRVLRRFDFVRAEVKLCYWGYLFAGREVGLRHLFPFQCCAGESAEVHAELRFLVAAYAHAVHWQIYVAGSAAT